jgi:DNA-directed RNA polymerase subunit K/omega
MSDEEDFDIEPEPEAPVDSDDELIDEVDDIEIDTAIKFIPREKNPPKIKKYIYVEKNERQSSNYMQNFEYANYIATRAAQISATGRHFANIQSTDPIELAENEVLHKKAAMSILREVGKRDGRIIVEIWDLEELIIL